MNTQSILIDESQYRTTQRCTRLECALTVRLLSPIDCCPRCDAQLAVVDRPARDLDELVHAATEDVVAGLTALLGAAPRR